MGNSFLGGGAVLSFGRDSNHRSSVRDDIIVIENSPKKLCALIGYKWCLYNLMETKN